MTLCERALKPSAVNNSPYESKVSNKRILLIDDEPMIVFPLFLFLSGKGYSVSAVNSPEIALDLLNPNGFDVIITDYQMKPVDGVELIRHFRAGGFTGRIALMSAYCSESIIDVNNCGIDAFFRKPFELQTLYGKIAEWTEKEPVKIN
jgi:two-component system NtrC family response regulator